MPDKTEKEKRKQLLNDLRKKVDHEFEKSLPVNIDIFKKLFDHLDEALGGKGCDDINKLTKAFLAKNNVFNTEQVLA